MGRWMVIRDEPRLGIGNDTRSFINQDIIDADDLPPGFLDVLIDMEIVIPEGTVLSDRTPGTVGGWTGLTVPYEIPRP